MLGQLPVIGGLAQGLFESLILIAFALEALKVECRDVEHKSFWTVIQGVKRSIGSGKKGHSLDMAGVA